MLSAVGEEEQPAEEAEEVDVGASLEFGKKKKKKSIKFAADVKEGDDDDLGLDDLNLSLGKKKKKKKSKTRTEDDFGVQEDSDEPGKSSGGLPWDGTDRDYKYEELLDRVFGILKENNPELTGERRRTTLKPPQVAREGTKKTVFLFELFYIVISWYFIAQYAVWALLIVEGHAVTYIIYN